MGLNRRNHTGREESSGHLYPICQLGANRLRSKASRTRRLRHEFLRQELHPHVENLSVAARRQPTAGTEHREDRENRACLHRGVRSAVLWVSPR